jgi:hypothetical protein
MKKYYALVASLLCFMSINAQSLSPSVIASTGGFSSNAGNSISYTVGEMTMVQTFSASGTILTQGFQQPNDFSTGLLAVNSNASGDLVIYPNPAVDQAWYAFEFTTVGNVSFVVTNVLGQKVIDLGHEGYDGGKVSRLAPLSTLAGGTYFLTATFVDKSTGSTSLLTRKFEIIR